MRIEKQKPDFNPVTIVIETQEEADLLLAITARTGGNHANDMMFKIFTALGGNEALHNGRFEVATGSIRTEEVA